MVQVIGDVFLDTYHHCEVVKRNPEGKGFVLRVKGTEQFPGGAGAVAMMLHAIKCDVKLACAVTDDAIGDTTVRGLYRIHVRAEVLTDQSGIEKVRYVLDGTLLPNRFDREAELQLSPARIHNRLHPANCGLILSDYGKGVFAQSSDRLRELVDAATFTVIDPHARNNWQYPINERCIIKCTRTEAGGRTAEQIAQQYKCSAIVSDGANGFTWSHQSRNGHIPARCETPRCVSGAGDAICAGLAAALSRGETWDESVLFAAECAAECCRTLGARIFCKRS